VKTLGELFEQFVSKILNLCGHDPPMSQTDEETGRQTIVHRAVKSEEMHTSNYQLKNNNRCYN